MPNGINQSKVLYVGDSCSASYCRCPHSMAGYETDWPSASNHQTYAAWRDSSHDKAEALRTG